MTTAPFPCLVVATIPESIDPMDRAAKYDDPLDLALKSAGVGMVSGAGSQLDVSRQIAFVDIELALANTDGALELARTTLKSLGAPKGSVMSFSRDGTVAVIAVATGEPSPPQQAGTGAMQRRRPDSTAPTNNAVTYDQAQIQKTAEQLLASYRSLFVEAYALGPINRDAYEANVFAWYDAMTAEFASHGFSALGDLKMVKTPGAREPGAGPFARRFLSKDQLHRVDIFQIWSPKASDWVRVINIVTELSSNQFLWTTTAERKWNTPTHVLSECQPVNAPVQVILDAHQKRLAAFLAQQPLVRPIELTGLDGVLASENRCQALTAAFRRRQAVPTVDELLRMGSEGTLAALAHAEMRRLVFGDESSAWQVTTVDLPYNGRAPMRLSDLIEFALDQGIRQVEQAGSPLHPFLIEGSGRAHFFLCTKGDADPMEIALQTVRSAAAAATTCALVIDSRITMTDGKKVDAIVVMACERGIPEGEAWAQAYRPKGFLRSFKRLPMRERVGTARNLFDEAATASSV
ncbi:MAG: hypothetical protein U0132_05010 [Gemmatimonadaceae bacterium]